MLWWIVVALQQVTFCLVTGLLGARLLSPSCSSKALSSCTPATPEKSGHETSPGSIDLRGTSRLGIKVQSGPSVNGIRAANRLQGITVILSGCSFTLIGARVSGCGAI